MNGGTRGAPRQTVAGAAGLARNVIAAAHTGHLLRAPGGVHGPSVVTQVSIVDDGGEPWVLAPPWQRPPTGAARLQVTPPPEGTAPAKPSVTQQVRGYRLRGDRPLEGRPGCMVLLAGRLEACVVAAVNQLPAALRAALDRHRACIDLDGLTALSVARFAVASIGVAVRCRDGSALRPLERVPLSDYAACEPDLWAIQGPAVLAQLDAHHGEDLLRLARCAGRRSASFAAAHSVDPSGVTLAVFGPAGADYVRVPFARRLSSPAEVGPELFGC
jgi:hypothetical protein